VRNGGLFQKDKKKPRAGFARERQEKEKAEENFGLERKTAV